MSNQDAYSAGPPQGEPIQTSVEHPPPTGIPVVHNDNPVQAGASGNQTDASYMNTETAPPPPSGAPVDLGASPAQGQTQPSPSGAPVNLDAPSGAPVNPGAPGGNENVATAPPPPDGQPVLYDKQTDLKNGINKCPSCGSSDISLNATTGLLHCNYCQREFSEEADTIHGDISKLSGIHMGMGATDIMYDAADVLTLKCTACGAEVVVDTNEAPQARCHWCRNMLSLNQQVPNGAVPDAVMPFRIGRDDARKRIEEFVGKRQFFAHPKFKAEFTTENVMGVYLPYMVIDVNAHVNLRGQGEHLVRKYTVGSGDDKETRYDADLYDVGREFDLYINDLTVEASSDKLNQDTNVNSNNIINSILPYPVESAVRFNANYLRGFTSEKRSVNREQVEGLVAAQVRDIARYRGWQQALFYDRGIRWDSENYNIKGELWKTVYLPVWLYSYLQVKPDGKKFLHYVAVNACTGETMGSVPIHKPKLFAVSAIIEVIGAVLGIGLTVVLLFTS